MIISKLRKCSVPGRGNFFMTSCGASNAFEQEKELPGKSPKTNRPLGESPKADLVIWREQMRIELTGDGIRPPSVLKTVSATRLLATPKIYSVFLM